MKWSSWPSKKYKTCLDQYWKSPLLKTTFPQFVCPIPVNTCSNWELSFFGQLYDVWRSLFRKTSQSNIFISEDFHFNFSNIEWIQTRRNNQSYNNTPSETTPVKRMEECWLSRSNAEATSLGNIDARIQRCEVGHNFHSLGYNFIFHWQFSVTMSYLANIVNDNCVLWYLCSFLYCSHHHRFDIVNF